MTSCHLSRSTECVTLGVNPEVKGCGERVGCQLRQWTSGEDTDSWGGACMLRGEQAYTEKRPSLALSLGTKTKDKREKTLSVMAEPGQAMAVMGIWL